MAAYVYGKIYKIILIIKHIIIRYINNNLFIVPNGLKNIRNTQYIDIC
jgi:hypothetical protein